MGYRQTCADPENSARAGPENFLLVTIVFHGGTFHWPYGPLFEGSVPVFVIFQVGRSGPLLDPPMGEIDIVSYLYPIQYLSPSSPPIILHTMHNEILEGTLPLA